MPIMNGVEATKKIASLIKQYNLPSIPIIGCSAFEAKDDIERCKNAGMISHLINFYKLILLDYLKKPVNVNILKGIIDELKS